MGELTDPWAATPVEPVTIEEPDDVFDSKQAADALGVTEAHLRQLVKRGQLAPMGRKGKRSTFSPSQVRALAEKRGVSRVTTTSDRYADLT